MKSESASAAVVLLFFILMLMLQLSPCITIGERVFEFSATTLEGHVVNATAFTTISGAKIHVDPGNLTAETDTNVSFYISLPSPGNYIVNASADGYISSEEAVYCAENRNTHIDVPLFPLGTSFENGTIYGYVVDGMTGLPVISANISITPGNLTSTTDHRGFYSVSTRSSTYYTITANATGYYDASTFVFLELASSTNASFYMTPREEKYGWIYGYVYDLTNSGRIANAEITISPGGNTTYSDGQGHYNFTVVGGVTYTVQAIAEGYQAGSKTVQVSPGNATRVDIPLIPVLHAVSRIEGYVYDIDTGKPLQSAIIVATPGNLSAVTNASGYYYLELTPGVNYTIRCNADGYIENHTYVIPTQDEQRQIDFYLRPEYENGRVYGRVHDITNQTPLMSAIIVVEPDGTITYTNLTGEYQILLRKGFDYRISVSCENYTPQTHTFFLNENEFQLDFYLYPRIYNLTVNITGVVRDPAGNPVENAEVVLRSSDGKLLRINYTDSTGNFLFSGLPVILNYSITISATGYIAKTLHITNVNFTSDTYSVPPTLTRMERAQTENFDYMPFVISSILITVVVIAFAVLYYSTTRVK